MRITAVPRNSRASLRGCTALASAATLTAAAAVLATSSPPAQAAISHRPDATTPGAISYTSTLTGVSANSATNAWAAGQYLNSSGVEVPLLLHWNGKTWTKAKNPTLKGGSQGTYLYGISVDSATDAWAAGYYNSSSSGEQEPLLLHWNGTAWKQVTGLLPSGATTGDLEGVSAVSATDAWVGGYYENSSGVEVPLLLHWNGKTWTKAKNPTLKGGSQGTYVYGPSVDSATDAWAPGEYENSSGVDEMLLLHWNGTGWSQAKSPAPSATQIPSLNGVSADSPTDAWAAGGYHNNSGVLVPLLLHWNGTAWKQVATSAPSGAQRTILDGVSADSPTDAWAAGDYTNSSGVLVPLLLHWNGKTWTKVASHSPSGTSSIEGVSADSATDAWAVGTYEANATTKTLTLHWNGKTWTQVKSPNGA